ncbi:MAG: TonB-dependent siderophore receptor [Bryobacterales bacterium]
MTIYALRGSEPSKLRGKRKAPSGWPEVYKWLATGTLVVYTAVGSRTVAVAAPQAGGSTPSSNQTQALVVRSFDIAPGPLEEVLRAFERATELQVNVPNQAIRTIQSPGVSGTYTNRQALQQLLTDTGVNFRFSDTGSVTLELATVSTSIEVTAQAAQPESPKYTEPLREIPQTISIISRNVIEQQGATTLTDVLRNVPGLTVVAGEGGAPAGDNLVLRGFSARNDIFVDGVRDLGPQSRDPFNIEQVEVVKGPQSAFTGRGSTGGSINMVSKTPQTTRMFGGSLSLGSASMQRGTGDVNLPIGDRTAFRLNVMAHDAGVPGRDVVESDRWGVAPSLAFGLGTPTRVTLGYYKIKQDNISDYGIPWVTANHNVLMDYRNKPAPVPRETFYGFRTRDHEEMGSDMGTARLEHDFSDSFVLRNQFRYGRSTRDSIATPPRFASPDSTVINREMRSWITEDDIYDNQTDLTIDFATGGIRHSVVTGAAFTKENNIRQLRTAPNSPTTLLNPNPDDVYTGEFTLNPNIGDIDATTKAVYLFDTLHLGRRWQVNGGVRSENFDVDGLTTGGALLSHGEHMMSLRAGVVFSPKSNGTIYSSYGSSLNPSLEGLSYTTGGAAAPELDPEKTYTIELGTKWDFFQNRLLLSGALFQVTKHNARTPGILPDDPPQVLDGRQRVRGVELGATGYITPAWMVFGGYSYLDSEIIETNNPAELGNVFPMTPDHSFNLWTTYTFPWKVTLGGGVRYVGRRYNNTANVRFVDGYATVDAMLSFPLARFLDVRLNVYNLTNEYYYERLGGGHVIPGVARSAMVSTVFRF